MPLRLSKEDQEKLDGEHGPATKMAMSIIVKMAAVYQAETLMDISGAHIDSTLFIGDGTLEFAEKLMNLGAKVVVPTSLNVSGVDEFNWQDWAVPPEWAEKARRQMVAYQSMGTVPTWTCAPYQSELRPEFGQQIAWGESNAIAFANSVIGARTERYPDLLDICAAITGRVPAQGLHLTKNRAGQLLLSLENIPKELQESDSFYPVLGAMMGKYAREKIPVVDGLEVKPNDDQLKALGAAGASFGAVAMFHLVGVTPEAETLEAAFQGKEPPERHTITMKELYASYLELSTSSGKQVDMVVLGSPHFSLDEFKKINPLVAGKKKSPNVEFLITSSRAMALLAEKAGFLDQLRAFGAKITLDTCILTTPMLPESIKILMTNSAKYSFYSPGLLNAEVVYGSLEDCVNSTIEGTVLRDESIRDMER
ncbi:MAG: DUF521 domain-containing protein [Chloroflexi bacterium]|nr:DUF521 domain-containing protein [Chloroflexota bacterium]